MGGPGSGVALDFDGDGQVATGGALCFTVACTAGAPNGPLCFAMRTGRSCASTGLGSDLAAGLDLAHSDTESDGSDAESCADPDGVGEEGLVPGSAGGQAAAPPPPLLTLAGAVSPLPTYVEAQTYGDRRDLCALHALNNILGYARFTYGSLHLYAMKQAAAERRTGGGTGATAWVGDYVLDPDHGHLCNLGVTFVLGMLGPKRDHASASPGHGRRGGEGWPELDWVWASPMGPLGAGVTGAAAQHQVDVMHTMMAGTYAAEDSSARRYGFSGLLFHRGPSMATEAGHYWAVRPAGDGTFFEVDSVGSQVARKTADDVDAAVMTALGGERTTVVVVGTLPPTTTYADLCAHARARRQLTWSKRRAAGPAEEEVDDSEGGGGGSGDGGGGGGGPGRPVKRRRGDAAAAAAAGGAAEVARVAEAAEAAAVVAAAEAAEAAEVTAAADAGEAEGAAAVVDAALEAGRDVEYGTVEAADAGGRAREVAATSAGGEESEDDFADISEDEECGSWEFGEAAPPVAGRKRTAEGGSGDDEESTGDSEEETPPGAQEAGDADDAASGEESDGGRGHELVGFSDSEDEWGGLAEFEEATPPAAAAAVGRKRAAEDAFGDDEGSADESEGTAQPATMSADAAAGSAEGVEMEVADPTDTTTTTGRRKRPKRPGKKKGGKLRNAGKFRAQRRDHDDGDGGGAGIQVAPKP